MGSEVRIGSRARGSRNRFQGSEVWIGSKVPRFFAQYSFGVFWASWGGSRKKNGFREPFREPVPMGSEVPGTGVPGSGNRVPGTKGIRKVPDSGDSVPKVPKVTLYFESILLHSGCYTFVLRKYTVVL